MSYAVETAVVSWRWTALRGAGSENGEAAGLLDRPAWPARLADGHPSPAEWGVAPGDKGIKIDGQ